MLTYRFINFTTIPTALCNNLGVLRLFSDVYYVKILYEKETRYCSELKAYMYSTKLLLSRISVFLLGCPLVQFFTGFIQIANLLRAIFKKIRSINLLKKRFVTYVCFCFIFEMLWEPIWNKESLFYFEKKKYSSLWIHTPFEKITLGSPAKFCWALYCRQAIERLSG